MTRRTVAARFSSASAILLLLLGAAAARAVDTDGDGLLDAYETDTGSYVSPTDTGTDPLVPDSDADGYDDGEEVSARTNPNDDGNPDESEPFTGLPRVIDVDASGAHWIGPADLDGDGDLDALAVTQQATTYTISWYDNAQGDGSLWTPHTLLTLPLPQLRTIRVTAADLDGDDDLDIALGHLWLENLNGDASSWGGTFVCAQPDPADGAGFVAVGNPDGDADLDMFYIRSDAGTQDATLTWCENAAGDGSTWVSHDLATPFLDGWRGRLLSVDLNGNGDEDLVLAANVIAAPGLDVPQVIRYENTLGDGTQWTATTHSFTPGIEVLDLYHGDVTRDGHPDLTAVGLGNVGILEGPDFTTVFPTAIGAYRSVHAADIFGTGLTEVLVTSTSDRLMSLLLAQLIRPTFLHSFVPGASSLEPADLDGDGDLDLLFAGSDAALFGWLESKLLAVPLPRWTGPLLAPLLLVGAALLGLRRKPPTA